MWGSDSSRRSAFHTQKGFSFLFWHMPVFSAFDWIVKVADEICNYPWNHTSGKCLGKEAFQIWKMLIMTISHLISSQRLRRPYCSSSLNTTSPHYPQVCIKDLWKPLDLGLLYFTTILYIVMYMFNVLCITILMQVFQFSWVFSDGEVTLYHYGWKDCATLIFYFFIAIILHAVVQEYLLDVST